ncbi:MAG TPA: hypothetical protein VGV88_12560 [Candidatus Dormibacteraeota bacterium]|nr:hypothetical protein [Candidatus Dormibacteraeota bacterium]
MVRFAPLLLLLVAVCACDAFWEGPTLPGGAKSIAYTVLSEQGPVSNMGTFVVADTSIAALRASVAQRTHQRDCHIDAISSDPCWEKIADEPGRLYVAMTRQYVCGTVRETAVLSGSTLYFIYWIGRPQGPCGDASQLPYFRLVSFHRSDLPPTGCLAVDLQIQEGGTTTDYRTGVTLS